MTDAKSYVFVIERAEDGMYWAYLPDLPGCATSAESPEAVQKQLSEAAHRHVDGCVNGNDPTHVR